MANRHRLRSHGTALATLVCAAAIGACGSSGNPAGGGPSGGPLLKLAECMRSHGVTGFPDPKATGGLVIPSNINPQSPVFVSAQRTCAKTDPSPAAPGGMPSESERLEMLALAKCMRRHGLANFPDPTSKPPPPSDGNAIGGHGVFLSIGNPQSPTFKSAAAACRFRLP